MVLEGSGMKDEKDSKNNDDGNRRTNMFARKARSFLSVQVEPKMNATEDNGQLPAYWAAG
jgi:hypothetical protein